MTDDSSGFTNSRIMDVTEREGRLDIKYRLGASDRKKVRGDMGEKIADMIESRVLDFISEDYGENWIVGGLCYFVNEDYYTDRSATGDGGRHTYKRERREGGVMKVFDSSPEDYREELERQYFYMAQDLMDRYIDREPRSIDNIFTAFKLSGETETVTFEAFERSEGIENMTEEDLVEVETELQVVEDFEIIAVEVKTTQERSMKALSKTQKKVLEEAKQSDNMKFYTFDVNFEEMNLQIPRDIEVDLKRRDR